MLNGLSGTDCDNRLEMTVLDGLTMQRNGRISRKGICSLVASRGNSSEWVENDYGVCGNDGRPENCCVSA
jgi:hypothetical protein